MTDIVKRLRANDAEIYLPLLGEAADYIERLREALTRIAYYQVTFDDNPVSVYADIQYIARTALGETK